MAYADYDFYTTEYLGNEIKAADFPRLAQRASEYIDNITKGRAQSYTGGNEIKFANCAIAEVFQQYEQGGVISSETSGRESVTYVTGRHVPRNKKAYATASEYLRLTGLLYAGVGM